MNIIEVENLEDFVVFRLQNNFSFTTSEEMSRAFYWMWKSGLATVSQIDDVNYSDFYIITFITEIDVNFDIRMFFDEVKLYPTFWGKQDELGLEIRQWYLENSQP